MEDWKTLKHYLVNTLSVFYRRCFPLQSQWKHDAKPHEGASEPAVDTCCLSPVQYWLPFRQWILPPVPYKNMRPAQRYRTVLLQRLSYFLLHNFYK